MKDSDSIKIHKSVSNQGSQSCWGRHHKYDQEHLLHCKKSTQYLKTYTVEKYSQHGAY